MITTAKSNLKQRCNHMSNCYETNLDGWEKFSEIMNCRMLLKTGADVKRKTTGPACVIAQCEDGVFPNLRVCLQNLLTVATSIASCEPSFSKSKLILFNPRSTITQVRFSTLAVLSIERAVTDIVNFEKILDHFAVPKARRVSVFFRCFGLSNDFSMTD